MCKRLLTIRPCNGACDSVLLQTRPQGSAASRRCAHPSPLVMARSAWQPFARRTDARIGLLS
eukprot:365817-Chlamydomonas_euryale.AAC.21